MTNTIYIGARLGNDGVYTNEIFTERPQEMIDGLKGKYPLIGYMFVPVSDLANAKDGIKVKGSIYNRAYEETKGGGKVG